jgi:RNA polymerase sigma factor (sigma-70 family)
MLDDAQLLRLYQAERSEAAFTELVRRHVNLVYYAALRRVGGDRQLAEDVAQRVFSDLARKAATLGDRRELAGWLYTSTRFAAAHLVRTEQRRRKHEQEAQTMQEINAGPEADWNQLRPVIDDAMDQLEEPEREAVLLRFFEQRPLAEVGARFSISADAARMRIERALEKLRGHLAKRGIASSSAGLTAVFAGQAKLPTPEGIVGAIAAAACREIGAATAATLRWWRILPAGGAAIAAIGVAVYVAQATRHSAALASGTADGEAIEAEAAGPPAAAAAPAPVPNAASAAAAARPEAAAEFGLPPMQKEILRKLWEHKKAAPEQVWAFRYAPSTLRYVSFEAAAKNLRRQGLVGIKAITGMVFLTPAGAQFCAAHERAILSD